MATLITCTPRIKKAILLINDLDDAKFPLLLSRILQNLHNKDERCFSEDEEMKLQHALGLDQDGLILVLETLSFILEQVAYFLSKPALLQQQLHHLELAQNKVDSIVEIWSSGAKSVVEKLRERSLFPKQLDSVHWKLNLEMAQANKTKLKIPTATFELGVYDESNKTTENLALEFNHEELFQFYSQLENIQSQLDSLR